MAYDRRAFLKTTLVAAAALASDAQVQGQASPMFPGFTTQKIQTSGATIHTLRGGSVRLSAKSLPDNASASVR